MSDVSLIDSWRRVVPEWDPNTLPNLSNKVYVVTGGNSGIGFDAVRVLARKGAKVIIASRSLQRGTRAIEQVKEEQPDADVEFMLCDVSSFKSIRKFADEYKSRGLPVHGLINNAGVFLIDPTITEDGLEVTWETNFYGPHYLTSLLCDVLRRSAPSRVVFVVSPSEQLGRMHWDDLRGINVKDSKLVRYGTSKLYELMLVGPWQHRLGRHGVDVFAVHPGLSKSSLFGKTSKGLMSSIFNAGQYLIAQPQKNGAISMLYTVAHPALQGRGGGYYGPPYFWFFNPGLSLFNTTRLTPVNSHARNKDDCERLWEEAEKIINEAVSTSKGETDNGSDKEA